MLRHAYILVTAKFAYLRHTQKKSWREHCIHCTVLALSNVSCNVCNDRMHHNALLKFEHMKLQTANEVQLQKCMPYQYFSCRLTVHKVLQYTCRLLHVCMYVWLLHVVCWKGKEGFIFFLHEMWIESSSPARTVVSGGKFSKSQTGNTKSRGYLTISSRKSHSISSSTRLQTFINRNLKCNSRYMYTYSFTLQVDVYVTHTWKWFKSVFCMSHLIFKLTTDTCLHTCTAYDEETRRF